MSVYCYDTEFLDDGKTIEFISIGIVCDDGREYYAVNSDMATDRICGDKWLKENVWPHLPIEWDGDYPTVFLDTSRAELKPKWVIANEVREFLLAGDTPPDLWAYYAAYDHVVLAQLYGPMRDLPNGIPMWTHDLMQLTEGLDGFVPPEQSGYEHHALADARWNLDVLRAARAYSAVQS